MAIIKAKKVPRKELSVEDILSMFCYKYPQYKYHEARKLPYKRIIKMLKVAEKEDAKLLYTLTEAIAAPHTKRGAGVKSLFDKLKRIING